MAVVNPKTGVTARAGVRREWTDARRIVVKIGSALLVDRASGRAWILKDRSAWVAVAEPAAPPP